MRAQRAVRLAAAALLAACGRKRADDAPAAGFEDAAPRLGIAARNRYGRPDKPTILESVAAGAAWFDFDRDGDLDLVLTNGSSNGDASPDADVLPTLYRNDGGRFVDATRGSGLDVPRWWVGVAAGDYDGDGDPDLYCPAYGSHALFRNETAPGGPPRFVEVDAGASPPPPVWGASASFFDADRDGDLDLYAANYLRFDPARSTKPCDWRGQPVFCGPRGFEGAGDAFFRNEGDGRFVDAREECGLDPGVRLNGMGCVAGDFDGDGDPDLYVANDRCRNLLFVNDGRGAFSENGVYAGVAFGALGEEHGGMGTDFGDADGDGDFDLFVTNFEDENNDLYRNEGEFFLEVSAETGLDRPSRPLVGWGTRFFDADLDGDEDLFVAYGHVYPQADRRSGAGYRQRAHLYRNEGGRFAEAGERGGPAMAALHPGRGVAFGDFDGDGRTDLVVVNLDEAPTLLRNGLASGNWIGLALAGRRSNRDAFGARVTLESRGRRQVKEVHADGSIFSSSDPRLVFGLGADAGAEAVTVRWPSGLEERASGLAPGRYHLWVEGAGVVGGSGSR